MSHLALLEVDRIEKSFGGLRAVDGLTFGVSSGEILGLIGPNGSGKTTALNLISGALKPTGGSVRLGGHEIAGRPAHEIAHFGITRTFQLVRCLQSLTAMENIIAGLAFGPNQLWGTEAHARAELLLELVGLGGRGAEMPSRMTYIDQKRIELGRALARDPKVLLLDEFLAGLNPTELQLGVDLISELRNEGRTIILVEHVMEAIRSLCDHCVAMNAGAKIAEGTPDDVLGHPEVIQAYLGESDA
ncbi:MAG: ABC transporter ATP-binding protein [Alphaproteobacteria bacterium]